MKSPDNFKEVASQFRFEFGTRVCKPPERAL